LMFLRIPPWKSRQLRFTVKRPIPGRWLPAAPLLPVAAKPGLSVPKLCRIYAR